MNDSFNPQTYACPVHGLLTGDEVHEEEVDYGDLVHRCAKCKQEQIVTYVGHRVSPTSKPVMPTRR